MNIRAYLYGRDRIILSQTLARVGALDGVLRVEFGEAPFHSTQVRLDDGSRAKGSVHVTLLDNARFRTGSWLPNG